MPKVARILIVDDHALFREGLVSVFNKQPDFNVVGEAATVREALSIAQEKQPDMVLLDVGLPDGDGLRAMEQIHNVSKNAKVVFLTVHESKQIAFAALRGGAKGYLTKDIDIQKMLVALRAVERGQLAISRDLSSRYIEETTRWLKSTTGDNQSQKNLLTRREIDILKEIGAGFDNKTVGEHLNISPNTVKVHIYNITRKLGLHSREELLAFAQRHGFDDSLVSIDKEASEID